MPVDASEAAGPASPASASGTPSEAPPTVPFFKKKKKGSSSSSSSAKGKGKGGDGVENAVLRSNTETAPSSSSSSSALKRRTREDDGVEQGRDDDDDDAADQGPSVVRLSKKQEYNPLRQGTSAAFNKRRRRGQHGVNDEDDDEDDDDYYGTTSNSSTRVGVQFSDRPSSRRARSPSPRGGGGKEEGDDGRVLSGNAALAKAGEAVDDDDGDPASRGLYKGAAAYQSKLPAGSKVYTEGIKAPSASIRTITLVDYQPDVCKGEFVCQSPSTRLLHGRGGGSRAEGDGWREEQGLLTRSCPNPSLTDEDLLPLFTSVPSSSSPRRSPHDLLTPLFHSPQTTRRPDSAGLETAVNSSTTEGTISMGGSSTTSSCRTRRATWLQGPPPLPLQRRR